MFRSDLAALIVAPGSPSAADLAAPRLPRTLEADPPEDRWSSHAPHASEQLRSAGAARAGWPVRSAQCSPLATSPRAPCAGAFLVFWSYSDALRAATYQHELNERRNMPNTEKVTAVAEIVERFTESSATVITEYRGLTVKQISQLRRNLGQDTTYTVLKNTLTKRAAAEAGIALDESLLVGPTAIAFVKGDPVEAAKGLRDFARTNPLLVIKGGVLDGKSLSAAEVSKIADLESREVLLAKVAGALKALPSRAAGLFQAPLSQVARLVKALEEKTPGDVAEAAPAAEVAPVADDAPAADVVVADAAATTEAPAEPAE
ncbi:MAG: large subunit ribosomal protein [Pseudonocardiales bacterium]|nr:large subunit ribosomal protein [Pseudonocardiales bacterium]